MLADYNISIDGFNPICSMILGNDEQQQSSLYIRQWKPSNHYTPAVSIDVRDITDPRV